MYLCFPTKLSVTRTVVSNAWLISSAESKWSNKEATVAYSFGILQEKTSMRKVTRLRSETGTSEVRSMSSRHLTALLSKVSCLWHPTDHIWRSFRENIEEGCRDLCSVRIPVESLYRDLCSVRIPAEPLCRDLCSLRIPAESLCRDLCFVRIPAESLCRDLCSVRIRAESLCRDLCSLHIPAKSLCRDRCSVRIPAESLWQYLRNGLAVNTA